MTGTENGCQRPEDGRRRTARSPMGSGRESLLKGCFSNSLRRWGFSPAFRDSPTGSGRCTLRRGARGRQTVVGGQLPIDLVLGDRRLSTHYPLLPTCYGRRLRVGMAPGDALSFVLSGKDFRPFDKLRAIGRGQAVARCGVAHSPDRPWTVVSGR